MMNGAGFTKLIPSPLGTFIGNADSFISKME